MRELPIPRRHFLSRLALAGVAAGGPAPAEELRSWELDFLSAGSVLTPNEKFFVRNHFEAPRPDAGSWSLSIRGSVRHPFQLTYQDILKRPRSNLMLTIECAGNDVGGGAVSTAVWTGISLRGLLGEADLQPGARFVRLIGADQGVPDARLKRPIPYTRSIPLDKALHQDTILAFQMNGVPLPAEHGYPLRAIVPGWYGMDSVKWIAAIEVLDQGDAGYFMTERYVTARLLEVGVERTPVSRMLVKSQITNLHDGDTLPFRPYTIRGAAWSGECRISKVEVSCDGGGTWVTARLETQPSQYTWVLWEWPWIPAVPGEYTIVVRASDAKGRTQPARRDQLRFDRYANNWYHLVRCKVLAPSAEKSPARILRSSVFRNSE
jgi:DMSO/TMAO reductase YedYZ molybdopterin-dependent catalytic subunit